MRNVVLGLLVITVLLSACARGPIIDSRTGQSMMRGPQDNRDLSLEHFSVDVFGQYRLRHAFINAINIHRCYQGSPPDNVQLVMSPRVDGTLGARIVARHRDGTPSLTGGVIFFDGYKKSNVVTLHDGQKKEVHWVAFNSLCEARFAGGNSIAFSIRSSVNEGIREHVSDTLEWVSHPNRQYQANRFLVEPRTERVWGNDWTWYRAYIPTPVGDGKETWMTPIGDTGYYIVVGHSFVEAQRQNNTEDYQRARSLLEGILSSIKIEPIDPSRQPVIFERP